MTKHLSQHIFVLCSNFILNSQCSSFVVKCLAVHTYLWLSQIEAIGGSSQPNVYQFVSHQNFTIRSHRRIITTKRISLNVAHKFPALEYKHVLSFNKAPMHVCLYTRHEFQQLDSETYDVSVDNARDRNAILSLYNLPNQPRWRGDTYDVFWSTIFNYVS